MNEFIFFFELPGTFCALDICLSQIQDVGTLNVCQTVRRMRTQRAFSIQTPDQYYFCYNAILEYAQRQGLLPANQWAHTVFEAPPPLSHSPSQKAHLSSELNL